MLRIRTLLALAVLLGGVALVTGTTGGGTEQAGQPAEPVATLDDPTNPSQQLALGFEQRSHWLQPWRAYNETLPATRLLGSIGVNFNVEPREAAATARLLASAGVRRARIELGWDNFSPDDPGTLAQTSRYRTILLALKRNGIRPLVLLNANHGSPGPVRFFDLVLEQPAAGGAREIRLDSASASAVIPGRTGFNRTDGGLKAADVLITSISPDRVATLSKPLSRALPAGRQAAATLPFAPFQRPIRGGGANPDFETTLRGWLAYVDGAVRATREILGSTEFDVEIWNELSFGSDFLDANTYHDPDIDTGQGDVTEAILERTVAFLREPGRGLSSMGIANGFASQRPWDAGSTSPPGLSALSKHPYAGARRFPNGVFEGSLALDANGEPDADRNESGRWQDRFVPAYVAFLPEYYLTAIQTEHVIRDLSPYVTDVFGVQHGRTTAPPGGAPPTVWLTEWNMDPAGSAEGSTDRPLSGGERAFQAKAVLRGLVAFAAKGAGAVYIYGAKHPRLGIVTPSFFAALARKRYPGDAAGGTTIDAIRRLTGAFRGAQPLGSPRQLSLDAIADFAGNVQFQGDGTPGRPPLYNRDVVALFPFQVTPSRYVLATYVMTRDLSAPLPAERYRLTVGNVGSCGISVRATDPLSASDVPVRVVSCRGGTVVLELPLTDSVRLIQLDLGNGP